MSRRGALRTVAWLIGPLAWAAFFLTAYATESLVCSRGAAPAWHGAIVAAAALAAALTIIGRLWSRRSGSAGTTAAFRGRIEAALHGLSLLAIAWTALAALLVPACR